jgi:hypothetical protein
VIYDFNAGGRKVENVRKCAFVDIFPNLSEPAANAFFKHFVKKSPNICKKLKASPEIDPQNDSHG